jgi:hypothetical protein
MLWYENILAWDRTTMGWSTIKTHPYNTKDDERWGTTKRHEC